MLSFPNYYKNIKGLKFLLSNKKDPAKIFKNICKMEKKKMWGAINREMRELELFHWECSQIVANLAVTF